MAAEDDGFEPRLGHQRNEDGGASGRMVRGLGGRRVAQARAPHRRAGRSGCFGRGQQAAWTLRRIHQAQRASGRRSRRVFVRSSIHGLASGLRAARAHLRYLTREGVTRDGEAGRLYDAAGEELEGGDFLAPCKGDRRQFRFIFSAEDGHQLADLRDVTCDVMRQMEADLGTRLDWVAADHFNTAHPHTHVVVRGKDELGAHLTIARDYLTEGLRLRAQERVTLELGLQTEAELAGKLEAEVCAERFTRIDRALLKEIGEGDLDLRPGAGQRAADRDVNLRLGRLKTLQRQGLAEQLEPGIWRLARDLEPRLRALGERGDILRVMRRAVTAGRLERAEAAFVIQRDEVQPVIGQLLDMHLMDEKDERMGLVIDGVDGKVHQVQAALEAAEPLAIGGMVEVCARPPARALDLAIARLAEDGTIYRPSAHLQALEAGRSPLPAGADAADVVASHVGRLEALRGAGIVERYGEDSWGVPKDLVARAQALEVGRSPDPMVRELCHLGLEAQVRSLGATWLDRQLVASRPTELSKAGFGAEVAEALLGRQAELVRQGHAQLRGGEIVLRPQLLAALREQELRQAGAEMAPVRGQRFGLARPGEEIRGRLAGPVRLASGAYALLDLGPAFTLVPWRPALEPYLGREIFGLVGEGGELNWRLGRERGLER